jgi:F0F1-type ATP synthase delta subunit
VTNKTAAIRYARALLDVAVKEKADLEQIERELAQFANLFKEYPLLEKVLVNPAVPVPRKRAAVADLLASAKFSPTASACSTTATSCARKSRPPPRSTARAPTRFSTGSRI